MNPKLSKPPQKIVTTGSLTAAAIVLAGAVVKYIPDLAEYQDYMAIAIAGGLSGLWNIAKHWGK